MLENFATRLKQLRTQMGFTQESLAEISKISVKSIERLEQCRPDDSSGPTLYTARRLASALGVSLDELAGNSVSSDEELPENVEKKECMNMNKFTTEIFDELKKISNQSRIIEIRKRPLTKATLDGLELDQILVKITKEWNDSHIFTKPKKSTDKSTDKSTEEGRPSYCTITYAHEVVTRYVQGRDELKAKYNL